MHQNALFWNEKNYYFPGRGPPIPPLVENETLSAFGAWPPLLFWQIKHCQPGLLMRPEHSETRPRLRPESARPRSRPRPRPKICYKTETKNYKTKTKTETSPVKSIACESNTNQYVSFFITHMRRTMNRKWILHLKWPVNKMFNDNN